MIEKPYVLRVAELIYFKIIEIKNQNSEINNLQAFEIFMGTKEYELRLLRRQTRELWEKEKRREREKVRLRARKARKKMEKEKGEKTEEKEEGDQ